MLKVTLQQLIDSDACFDAKDAFRNTFGDSADVTAENFEKFDAAYGWWGPWAFANLLTEEQRQAISVKVEGLTHSENSEACAYCDALKRHIKEELLNA